MHHVPNTIQFGLLILDARESHLFVLTIKILKSCVPVPLVVNRLPNVLKKLVALAQDEKKIVGILAGLYFCADQLLVAGISNLFCMDVLLIYQSLPSPLFVSLSIRWPFAFENLDDVVGRTG